jgi:DNA-binding response OmpR family regulator
MSELTGKIVLVVDDSASIRREVKAILQKEGFTVREAGTEFGMFNSLTEYGIPADLVIMDLSLNDANGFDLIKKIKAVDKFGNIPVIMLTQYSDRNNVIMAKKLGIQGYIVKPINPQILLEKVGKALEGTLKE